VKISPNGKTTLVGWFVHLPVPSPLFFFFFEGMWHVSLILSVREGQITETLVVVLTQKNKWLSTFKLMRDLQDSKQT